MKINQPSVHIDHMMVATRMHHIQLSSMADLKANILLTVSSVTLTLSMPYIVRPVLRWPAITLIFFCFLTVILAIYAVMPKTPLTIKRSGPCDTSHPFFNLLYFGNFVYLSHEEFEKAMEDVMNDTDKAYATMIKEIYTLGCFLAMKKYRYLRLAYLSFIAGFVSSGIVLAWTLFFPKV
ncbi:MAG: hypothetical protein JW884_03985 [Deltaproteobacteria bacterium]|nr:hypothetical protein [Deltaproteobacteria bacterium]